MTSAKHIVFDWNGTLLDDIRAMHDCMNIVMERAQRPSITMEHFNAHYDVPFERLYTNLGFTADEVVEMMAHDGDVFHRNYEPMADVAGLREGAVEILSHAKKNGVQSFILSNHIVDPIRAQLKRLDIENLFKDVLAYASRETQFRDMTKGERLHRYMDQHGFRGADTIIVGDSIEEIEIGREQGLISIAITGGCVSEQRLSAARPDYLIHTLRDLKPIMQQRGFMS